MLSYGVVHSRMGRASDQTCPCGRPAREWAYQGTGIRLVSPKGYAYSENPADYVAMCSSCHRKHDISASETWTEHASTFHRSGIEALRKRWEEPEFATRRKAQMAAAIAKRRRCLTCGLESNTGGIGAHLKASKHLGFEGVS